MNKQLRMRVLEKLAQINTTSLPSDQAAQTKPTTAAPPAFQASAIYPGIRYGFNTASIPIIDAFVSLLNTAVHYASNGAVNFQTFRNDSFNFDASIAPSVDQKNLMNLSKRVYHTLLNNGQAYKQALTGKQVSDMVDMILASPEFNNLSHVSPTGLLATKIQGNLKTLITNYLTYLKLANPATPQ